jgi:hypothetical protein
MGVDLQSWSTYPEEKEKGGKQLGGFFPGFQARDSMASINNGK